MKYQAERARPQAIDLADVPDFLLGSLRVQPSLRRVSAGGREALVEPRVMQALIALAEAGETVVSRDALIDRCWGGRIVGDDAINRCIAKVRRLADTAEPPAFIVETVSKVGYLLKIPPAAAAAPAVTKPAPQPHVPAASPARRWPVWLALGLMVGAAGAAAQFWRPWQSPHLTVQSSRTLPKLAGESDPRLSPNGSMLAYVADAPGGHGRVYVRNLRGGAQVAVSSPDEDAASPAWDSASARLAYVVAGRQGAPCRIMVTRFPGGTPALAGRCRQVPTTEIAWQPATPYLLLTDRLPFLEGQITEFFEGIFRLNIETGRSEQVTAPPASEADHGARVSPDGAWVAYIRGRGFAGQALRLRRLASSEERELDADKDIRSIDWTPDSRTLIASVPGQMGSEIHAYPIDGTPGYRIYSSASALGRLATGPGGMLAVEAVDQRTDLARATTSPQAAADIIDPSPGMTDWPAFAPDGTLAFVSSRSGEVALWTRKPGGQPVAIVRADVKDIERPVWSPDGQRIAFFEAWKGDITVHVVTAQGANVVAFAVPSIGFGLPNWTPDGEHLLLFDKRILRVVRIDLRHPDDREPVQDRMWDSTIYHKGAIYSVKAEQAGLWETDGTPRLVSPDYPFPRHARVAFKGDDVLLPDSNGGKLRILAQPLKGGPSRVAFYAPAAEEETPFAVDPLTGDVIYVSNVAGDSHIDLLTVARQ
jgi:Tol biopolymer transport system component/DNA-binding winged helix-turn-helix (wHTH) protein